MWFIILKFIAFVGFFLIGLFFVRKFVHHSKLEIHNEVAGFIYAVIGVIYAVLLAFVVVTVWEQFTNTEDRVSQEVSHLIDVYRNANAFPDSVKTPIQTSISDYMQLMIDKEWDAMSKNTVSEEAKAAYLKIWDLHLKYNPTTEHEKFWYAETIKELNALADARRYRIDCIYYGVPEFMWIILFIGAFLTISFSYLFGMKNHVSQFIMVFILAGIVCLILILIDALEHPFAGLIKVSDHPFRVALEQLK
jgi:hypothetical protein